MVIETESIEIKAHVNASDTRYSISTFTEKISNLFDHRIVCVWHFE